MIKMKLGDEFYSVSRYKKYTVIKEDSSGYYLALFDASCSDIKYVSKCKINKHNVVSEWFKSKEDMLKQRVVNAEYSLIRSKKSMGRYLATLDT